jgi:hypothetical protein
MQSLLLDNPVKPATAAEGGRRRRGAGEKIGGRELCVARAPRQLRAAHTAITRRKRRRLWGLGGHAHKREDFEPLHALWQQYMADLLADELKYNRPIERAARCLIMLGANSLNGGS